MRYILSPASEGYRKFRLAIFSIRTKNRASVLAFKSGRGQADTTLIYLFTKLQVFLIILELIIMKIDRIANIIESG